MQFREQAKQTLIIEADAVRALVDRIDEQFDKACQLIRSIQGRVVVIGMGKSGHIGNKIASTLASTGTPAFFVHPAEASHGDLGMITADDLVLALSNSGETDEVISILPVIKRLGVPLVAMTGNDHSTLAKQADVHLNIAVEKEACPLNLAPTASSTVTLALGDAIAVALLNANGFNAEDFARSHPGGKLGKKLLTYVVDIMRSGDELPTNRENDSLIQAIVSISHGGMGLTMVTDDLNRVIGVFTDGDLRRLFDAQKGFAIDLSAMQLSDYMHDRPMTIHQQALAAEALQIMEENRISALPIIDDKQQIVGAINMHDLLRAGIA
ncbi:MAG: D-arabinose 5-phosphate isomerase [Gammaproteobacteria bacterium]|nr:MAG: D-arabinose 5-phosphate isomerase [Gammaproteobacteria bacterium]